MTSTYGSRKKLRLFLILIILLVVISYAVKNKADISNNDNVILTRDKQNGSIVVIPTTINKVDESIVITDDISPVQKPAALRE